MPVSGSEVQILPRKTDPLVRQVGRILIERGLGNGTSLFDTPARCGLRISETTGELYGLNNEHLDMGTDTFLVKLRRQLNFHRAKEARPDSGSAELDAGAGSYHSRGWLRQSLVGSIARWRW
jgi:hypothetical protein